MTPDRKQNKEVKNGEKCVPLKYNKDELSGLLNAQSVMETDSEEDTYGIREGDKKKDKERKKESYNLREAPWEGL